MEFKLKKSLKDKWVKALRSGKYKQGRNRLYCEDTNSYCCLGVAHKLKLLRGYDTKCLPSKVQNSLIDRNDKWEWSFEQIATWIEKNL